MRGLVIVLLVFACSRPEPHGHAVALHATDDGGSVVAWVKQSRDLVLLRFDAKGTLVWQRPTGMSGIHASVVTGEGVVVLHALTELTEPPTNELAAFSVGDGKPLWKRPWNGNPTAREFRPMVVGNRYIDIDPEHRAVAIDLPTGEQRWSVPLRKDLEDVAVVGRRLFLLKLHDVSSVEIDSGELVESSVTGGVCMLDGVYYGIIDRTEQPKFASFPGADLRSSIVLQPLSVFDKERRFFARVESCGTHAGNLVFVVDTGPRFSQVESAVFLVIAGRDGTIRAVRELGADLDSRALPNGELPRFVLLDLVRRLVIVDLVEGKITWQGPENGLIGWSILRARNRTILHGWERSGQVIATLDGDTGELRAVSVSGARDIAIENVTDETIWLVGQYGDWQTLASSPLARLDTRTLKPRFARRIQVTDFTQEARRMLGM